MNGAAGGGSAGLRAAAAGGAPAGLPAGWRLEACESVPSTSAALRVRAEAGEAAGLAILARQQTAGRGRGGRAWVSPPGNLHLSLLLRPQGPLAEVAQWSLLAGVALAEAALETEPDPAALALKWPNDLLRHGAKVAGILTEAAAAPDPPPRLGWVILGIGANLAHAPPLPDRATATLAASGPPEAFAARLLARLGEWAGRQAREGFAPIRAAWSRHGPLPGTPLTVRLAGGMLEGRCAGLAADGGLLLDTPAGRRHILAGEVLAPALAAGAMRED